MSKKIAYLLGSLNRGGTETLVLDVLQNAKQNKLDVIGIYRKTGALEADFLKTGVVIYKLSFKKNIVTYLLKLRKLLKKERIQVAHAQQPIDALYAYLACVGTGIKVILTLHGYDFKNNRVERWLLEIIIKRTDINIYVSYIQRKYYEEKNHLNIKKQVVVYNGISFEKMDVDLVDEQDPFLSRILNNNSFRSELKVSSKKLLLGSVGNFNDVRDQLTICRFLKLLNEQNVDFHFVFVGMKIESTPELYYDCVNYCEENGLSNVVSFLGSRNDVPRVLNELDAFIYSTDHDTFGIAVVEAMAVGIPVFVNDWGVMNEISEGGEYATLYQTKNEGDLFQKFMLFLLDKERFQLNSKLASTFVRENYSIEKHIEKLKLVYDTE